MGWSSGTDIAIVLEKVILKYVPKGCQRKVATEILRTLEEQDWDCENEVDMFDYLSSEEAIKDYTNEDDEDERKELEDKIKKYRKKFGW